MTPEPQRQTPTGWADDRLMQAYDLVHAAMADAHPEHDAYAILAAVLVDIEDADCDLERYKKAEKAA